jgi:hypothetical protein
VARATVRSFDVGRSPEPVPLVRNALSPAEIPQRRRGSMRA